MNLDYDMKLGNAFPNLRDLELNIEELNFPARTYNTLKRCGIHTLQGLLAYSCNELLEHKEAVGRTDGLIDQIAQKIFKESLADAQKMADMWRRVADITDCEVEREGALMLAEICLQDFKVTAKEEKE